MVRKANRGARLYYTGRRCVVVRTDKPCWYLIHYRLTSYGIIIRERIRRRYYLFILALRPLSLLPRYR
jgi:hypothetical protein